VVVDVVVANQQFMLFDLAKLGKWKFCSIHLPNWARERARQRRGGGGSNRFPSVSVSL